MLYTGRPIVRYVHELTMLTILINYDLNMNLYIYIYIYIGIVVESNLIRTVPENGISLYLRNHKSYKKMCIE